MHANAAAGPGENVLEIWIKKGRFDPALVDGRVSTFVLIDFFDFESQPTKLHSGLLPNYNMATTFKVRCKQPFARNTLHSLPAGGRIIEIIIVGIAYCG